jgi:hypothetical protein
MNQVRSLLAVVAAALALAACEGAGSITAPALRNGKAAPNTQSGSGFHADNGGMGGSGYDLAPTGSMGSGSIVVSANGASTSGASHRPIIRQPRGFAVPTRPAVASECIVADNGGFGGSGYNFCPQ